MGRNGALTVRFMDTAIACGGEGRATVSLKGCVRRRQSPRSVLRRSASTVATDPKLRLALGAVSAKRASTVRLRPKAVRAAQHGHMARCIYERAQLNTAFSGT